MNTASLRNAGQYHVQQHRHNGYPEGGLGEGEREREESTQIMTTDFQTGWEYKPEDPRSSITSEYEKHRS